MSAQPHRRRWSGWTWLALGILVAIVMRAVVLEGFIVPSPSMAPTFSVDDRVVVLKLGQGQPRRGDVVVLDGTSTFAPVVDDADGATPGGWIRAAGSLLGIDAGTSYYLKRVVAVGGDRVRCCDDGRLVVNDTPMVERYLASGSAGTDRYDVLVPDGRIWVLGDNRSDSTDSRALLGSPGGGMIPVTDVVGPVVARYWPWGRAGWLGQAG